MNNLGEMMRLEGLRKENARAWAEVDRLRDALKRYGLHTWDCRSNETYGTEPCDCGFDEITAQIGR